MTFSFFIYNLLEWVTIAQGYVILFNISFTKRIYRYLIGVGG